MLYIADMDYSDSKDCISSTLVVKNLRGLHTRPSTMIFKLAHSYPDRIMLVYGNQTADAKNLYDILMLGACPDTELKVEIEGKNAMQILNGLQDIFDMNFGED